MKKLVLILAMATLGVATVAQTLEVESAVQDMRKKYLNKAKASIDKACNHDQTKEDAKTWYYKGLIYCQIGNETGNPKSKYKDLAPDWCDQAYDAALKCRELDKNNEWAESNNTVFGYVGGEYSNLALAAYNAHDFQKSLDYCEKSITAFGYMGDKKQSDNAYYIAGLCAEQLHDKDLVKKYFSTLMRRKTDKKSVYEKLYSMYLADSNKAEATKVANNYYKFHHEDYNSALMMSRAYRMNGNIEKSNEMVNAALDQTKDNPQVYSALLCAAAEMLVEGNDFEAAEAKYNESLQLVNNQFQANFGMGSMYFNRAVDKINAANDVPFDDETGLAEKLTEESKVFFGKAESYMKAAVAYIDALPEAQQPMQKANLYNCLSALKTIYARLQNATELPAINARLEAITKG